MYVNLDRTINFPYGVMADIHCHNWSAFSHINANGINNRLQHILDGIRQCADKVKAEGGNDIVIAGDLFHTRGTVKPSVFNPVFELFQQLSKEGFIIHAIPGNHDLEGKNSEALGNAMLALGAIPNFFIYNSPTCLSDRFLFIPWFEDSQKVQELATKAPYQKRNLTLFCHVGFNGVIPAVIGGTLDPKDFIDEGFKHVFSGHFHNHVGFDSTVYSIGALTHQTWSDIGSLAGFLIVREDTVEHVTTPAPMFIDDSSHETVAGNYVRLREKDVSQEQAESYIKTMMDYGALAVLDQTTRPTIIEKTYEHTIDIDLGMEKALEAYCKNTFGDKWKEVYEECLKLKS